MAQADQIFAPTTKKQSKRISLVTLKLCDDALAKTFWFHMKDSFCSVLGSLSVFSHLNIVCTVLFPLELS